MSSDLPDHREVLDAVATELQANRIALADLTNRFSVFLFTGGGVPTPQFALGAMTSYLERALAPVPISAREVDRYRRLAAAIAELNLKAAPGPKSLRNRQRIAEAFRGLSSEMRTLGDAMELAATTFLAGPQTFSPPSCERRHAIAEGGVDDVRVGVV